MPKPGTARAGLLATYDKLIAHIPGLERKGVTMPYTSVNGNMFSFIDKDDTFALRMSVSDRARFMQHHAGAEKVAHGIVLKEYVTVPAALFQDTEALAPFFVESHRYVSSLRPKPAKRSEKE